MRLAQLLSIYPSLRWGDDPNVEVTGVTQDSKKIEKGSVFVAIRGSKSDGHDYLTQVCDRGAIGVVVEDKKRVPATFRGAVVEVQDTRLALDHLAAHYFGRPAEKLFCVGVTGTNGKTSITYLTECLLKEFGWKTGVMGTIDHHLLDRVWSSNLTTPDPLTLQRRLTEFCALGAAAAVFEVSSHALDQHRVDQIPFDGAVFTNLTRDHLDYHLNMAGYFSAKERLFRELLQSSTKDHPFAIVNGDDHYGRRLQISGRARTWYYGQGDVQLKFSIVRTDFSGVEFDLKSPRGQSRFFLPMPGQHNVYNAVAAIGVALMAGCSLDLCASALSEFRGVPGRLESVKNNRGIHIFVDYAHTDDGLRTVLQALQEIRRGVDSSIRIVTVFGCGGDRDQGKRPLMGQVAYEGSDLAFVTNDNPRTEDPEKIAQEILKGIPAEALNNKVFVELDRSKAIGRALQSAGNGDVILIAGKGHENYQIVGQETRPFSDLDVVKEWLS